MCYARGGKLKDIIGNKYYMSPEMLSREHSKPTDMWSIGCLVYLIASGKHPFEYKYDKELYYNIRRGIVNFKGEVFDKISKEAKNFLSLLLMVDPSSRLTADEALNHKWFK